MRWRLRQTLAAGMPSASHWEDYGALATAGVLPVQRNWPVRGVLLFFLYDDRQTEVGLLHKVGEAEVVFAAEQLA